MTSRPAGMAVAACVDLVSVAARLVPRPRPRMMPSSAPITEMIIDSAATSCRSWLRCMPIARSRPISLVRSAMDSVSVLMTPSSAITIVRTSMAVTRVSSEFSVAVWFAM